MRRRKLLIDKPRLHLSLLKGDKGDLNHCLYVAKISMNLAGGLYLIVVTIDH